MRLEESHRVSAIVVVVWSVPSYFQRGISYLSLALRSNQAQVYWFDADRDGQLDGR